jgi:hypothetical protein
MPRPFEERDRAGTVAVLERLRTAGKITHLLYVPGIAARHIEHLRKSSAAISAVTDQRHTSTLRLGTFEKCLRLFVTTVIPWETACEAMRRSIFPIGLPERSNSERIRA